MLTGNTHYINYSKIFINEIIGYLRLSIIKCFRNILANLKKLHGQFQQHIYLSTAMLFDENTRKKCGIFVPTYSLKAATTW